MPGSPPHQMSPTTLSALQDVALGISPRKVLIDVWFYKASKKEEFLAKHIASCAQVRGNSPPAVATMSATKLF
jgi:hypothetical protein